MAYYAIGHKMEAIGSPFGRPVEVAGCEWAHLGRSKFWNQKEEPIGVTSTEHQAARPSSSADQENSNCSSTFQIAKKTDPTAAEIRCR